MPHLRHRLIDNRGQLLLVAQVGLNRVKSAGERLDAFCRFMRDFPVNTDNIAACFRQPYCHSLAQTGIASGYKSHLIR